MADSVWTLFMRYTFINGTDEYLIPIVFDAKGRIDTTKTTSAELELLTTMIEPLDKVLQLRARQQGIEVDFWELMNWLFVSAYWTLLADVGQVNPTIYPRIKNGGRHIFDFSSPTEHPSINNIFVNDTLFSIYSNYLQEVIIPLLGLSAYRQAVSIFAPLDYQNRLESRETTILRSYPCTIRRQKSVVGAFVSIVVADYAFIKGGYTLFIFFAAWYEKRISRDSLFGFFLADHLENFCHGCSTGKLAVSDLDSELQHINGECCNHCWYQV